VAQRVEVIAGSGGEDAQAFTWMLREMYGAWEGDLSGEAGVHRLIRRSPYDAEHRRVTCFARVWVDGDPGSQSGTADDQVRSYYLHPHERAVDHRTGFETPFAKRVLAGELALIRGSA
jgi:protein subunit release factor B